MGCDIPLLIIIFVLDLENFICSLDYFTNVYFKLKFTRISGKIAYFKCKFKFNLLKTLLIQAIINPCPQSSL